MCNIFTNSYVENIQYQFLASSVSVILFLKTKTLSKELILVHLFCLRLYLLYLLALLLILCVSEFGEATSYFLLLDSCFM